MTNAERADAIAWAARVADPDFDDWIAFHSWLEGDAARGIAYMEVTLAVDEAVGALKVSSAETAPSARIVSLPGRTGQAEQGLWRRWMPATGLALAAGIAALLFTPPRDSDTMRVIETVPGHIRHVTLADGSRIDLAGGARVVFDAAHPRQVRLERGRAVFTVTHDARAPFRVMVAQHQIRDVGTIFEVAALNSGADIQVAEGAVIVDPDRVALPLTAGMGASLRNGKPPHATRISTASIGQWRNGHMSYRHAPLSQVAGDLEVALGHPVRVASGLKKRRFTGSLVIATVRGRPAELGALLDVTVRPRDPRGWDIAE